MSFHKVTIAGTVTRDPEMRITPSGDSVTTLTVATTDYVSKEKRGDAPEGWKESYNGKGWEATIWWRISFWRSQAEFVNNFVRKGALVVVEGELGGEVADGSKTPRIWFDQQGMARTSYEATGRTIQQLKWGKDDGGEDDGDELAF